MNLTAPIRPGPSIQSKNSLSRPLGGGGLAFVLCPFRIPVGLGQKHGFPRAMCLQFPLPSSSGSFPLLHRCGHYNARLYIVKRKMLTVPMLHASPTSQGKPLPVENRDSLTHAAGFGTTASVRRFRCRRQRRRRCDRERADTEDSMGQYMETGRAAY